MSLNEEDFALALYAICPDEEPIEELLDRHVDVGRLRRSFLIKLVSL